MRARKEHGGPLRKRNCSEAATFCDDRRSHDADYLSKSIGSDCIDMNAFSMNPNLVAVDRNQASLIQLLEKQGLDVILAALQNVGRWAPIALRWTSAEPERQRCFD